MSPFVVFSATVPVGRMLPLGYDVAPAKICPPNAMPVAACSDTVVAAALVLVAEMIAPSLCTMEPVCANRPTVTVPVAPASVPAAVTRPPVCRMLPGACEASVPEVRMAWWPASTVPEVVMSRPHSASAS